MEVLSDAILAAAADGSSLVVFPELWLSGYAVGAAALRSSAMTKNDLIASVGPVAAVHRIAVAVGYAELDADGRIYNTVALVGRDGLLVSQYRKAHLFSGYETEIFTAGDCVGEVVPLALSDRIWKVSMLICFDIEFPEPARVCAVNGAELLIVPTALGDGPCAMVTPHAVIPARAMENHLFIAYSNFRGKVSCPGLGATRFCGSSAIVAPDGSELTRAGDAMGAKTACIDPARYSDVVARNPYLAVRRPQLYGSLTVCSGPRQGHTDAARSTAMWLVTCGVLVYAGWKIISRDTRLSSLM